jgi:hypothetical protein
MAIPKPRKKTKRVRRLEGLAGAPKLPGRHADVYFQEEVQNKQVVELVKSWIKANYSKSEASKILNGQPDWKFCFPHWACIIHTNDMTRLDYLHKCMEDITNSPSPEKKILKKEVKPSSDPVNNWIAELEEVVDDQNHDFDFYQFARLKNMNKAQIGQIVSYYSGEYEELLESKRGKSEDLKEAWGYLGRAGLVKRIAFFERMVSELKKHINNKKIVQRTRKPKVKSASQLIKGVKFLKESNELKIVSIDPTLLLDAKQLWVYNAKYRILTRYDALEGGLKIKGSTLLNFNTESSLSKKLRNPTEQLSDFIGMGKVKVRTFMENIKTKASVVPTGRLNVQTLLIKAIT